MIVEETHVIKEMYSVMRGILASAFETTHNMEYREVFARCYKQAEPVRLAVSVDKGFPYVSYATNPTASLNAQRNIIKMGRWMKAHLGGAEVPDHVIGEVVDRMRAIAEERGYVLGDSLSVMLLEGADICRAYHEGVGSRSCMAGSYATLTEFYAVNPRVCSLAVTSNRKARALIWRTEQGMTVMDRIYPNSGFLTQYLRNWALAQGYLVRSDQALPAGQKFVDAAGNKYDDLSIQFDKYAFDTAFPYMDTFYALASPWNDRRLHMRRIRESMYTLHSTSGGPFYRGKCSDIALEHYAEPLFGEGGDQRRLSVMINQPIPHQYICEACDCDIEPGDHYLDGDMILCNDCYWENHVSCDRCGTTMHTEDSHYLEANEGNYCSSCYDAVTRTCALCGETEHIDAVVMLDPSGEYCCSACAEGRRCPICRRYRSNQERCVCGHEPTT